MQKSKTNVEIKTLDAISCSTKIDRSEKISFLKYVGYMTLSERKQLLELI